MTIVFPEEGKLEIVSVESATCKLKRFPTHVRITSLKSKERRLGHATKLMMAICEQADKLDLMLYLEAQKYGKKPGMSNDELVDFYIQFGFVISDHELPVALYRPPISDQLS